ncbi:hypothetical protein G3578_17075 [Brevibacillus sp. SYP-B805]|uniref:hypothetical protein n=1 Tax=Brevibacillus sp. SYP-B805 TaxID=1578199 RepID=UPI0013E9E672|nr:hypothetical protein [Brevibacillus sp. SYP-B805]NGQ96880.1 hypothetical protein [Brevibacillus sp. SYP-B805]
MGERLQRAQERLNRARKIMADLGLLERWAEVGRPLLVGAVAYGLVVNPDIDMEIYCEDPTPEAGFRVIGKLAQHPNVTDARFSNQLNGPDRGLYFQLKYKCKDGEGWKIDMWLLPEDHPGPCARDLVEPLNAALTEETREAILAIKEDMQKTGYVASSIRIYEAVVDGGVRTPEAFYRWHEGNRPNGLTFWKPFQT